MKINDKVYRLDSTKGAYVYIILDEEIMLIDTGFSWQGKGLIKELALMNINLQDIKHILLTHHDLDHIGNASRLQRMTGAKLWASKEDIPFIVGEKHRSGLKKILSYIFRVENISNIVAFEHSKKIGNVEIISTPGHTPGHVCLLLEDVLFAGDLVKTYKSNLIPYPTKWNWNSSLLNDSIKKISQYPFKWICPAHGAPTKRSNMMELQQQ